MTRRQRSDEGFTLIELIISVVITSFITLVIASCIIVGLKTTDATAARLAESHDAQMLSTYLVADVQSASESGVNTAAGTSSGCGPAGDEGSYTSDSNVLRFSWTQTEPAPAVDYTASYRLAKNSSTGEWQLRRNACKDGAAATSTVVARQLADPSTSPPVVDISHLPAISLTLTEPSGYKFTVEAIRRTPPVSPLPAVPWACTVQSALASPDPAFRTSAAPGDLAANLSVEVQSGGDCPSLTLVVDPGGSAPYNKNLNESPNGSGHWIANISRTTGVWTDGDKSFPITQSSTVIGTLRMTVKQPCLVTTFTAMPNPARRSAGPAPSPLAADETLTAVSTGPCQPLVVDVAFDLSGPSTTVVLTESPIGSGNWSTTLPAATQAWSDGSHDLVVHEPGGSPLSTTTLVITPNCTVSVSSVSPNPVDRNNGTRSNQLVSDVTVALTTSGTCDALRVQFKPDGTTTTVVPMTESPPSQWTATLLKSAYPWTTGTKALNIRNSDNDIVVSLNLKVN
jgi:prepilin-type N-terminal cleavage/methylation domain-containing protein